MPLMMKMLATTGVWAIKGVQVWFLYASILYTLHRDMICIYEYDAYDKKEKSWSDSELSSMLAMMTMMTITTSATRAALDPSLPFLGSDNSAFLHLHIWVFDLLDFAHSCNCVSVGQGKCCRLVGTIKIGLILQLMRHLQDDIYAQDVPRCYLYICVQWCSRCALTLPPHEK